MTTNIQRLFDRDPPLEKLVTLAAIVRDWERRTAPGGSLVRSRDQVVELAKQAPSFRSAVQRACLSRDFQGRTHNHQSRVLPAVRLAFADVICGVWEADHAKFILWGFDVLHDRIEEIRPKGIGPVTTYDVATRIGAYLGIQPRSLYLHAGVWAEWKAMMGISRGRMSGRIPRDAWPVQLRHLPADQVGDLLCTYRSIFPQIKSI